MPKTKLSLRTIGMFLLLLGLAAAPALAGYISAGDKLGDLAFPPPVNPDDAKLLGVPADQPFKLSQLGAPYILIESFSTGCPHCYTHAPSMNKLYGLITKNPKTADKIKVLGLAASDSPNNLVGWKKQLKVPFALVPDPDQATTKKLNIMGTPTTIFMNKNGDVLLAKAGAFENAEEFLKELIGLMK